MYIFFLSAKIARGKEEEEVEKKVIPSLDFIVVWFSGLVTIIIFHSRPVLYFISSYMMFQVVIWAESGDGTSVATSQVTIRVFQVKLNLPT